MSIGTTAAATGKNWMRSAEARAIARKGSAEKNHPQVVDVLSRTVEDWSVFLELACASLRCVQDE